MLLIRLRFPGFNRQLAIQVISDIAFFSLMLYASGGLQSGLGVLLLVSLAGAGLISRGRLALFFASIATISLLLQETYSLWTIDHYAAQYSQAGLLSMAYFAVAWLAHRLAKYTLASEQLAKERGIDLANMAQVNQLVIQDLQEGVLVVDQYGYIRQRNAYVERLFDLNLSAGKAELLKLSDCMPRLANRLTSWQGDSSISFDLLRLAHSNATVRTRFLPIQADSRNGVVIFLEDMGRIQAQLQQLKLAALGRLTANIAQKSVIRYPLSITQLSYWKKNSLRAIQIPALYASFVTIPAFKQDRQDVLQLNRRNIAKPDLIDLHEFMGNFLRSFVMRKEWTEMCSC
ncbi:MAG: hypothetical protein IPI17_06690 [Nitrosomonas sp.]|nr:hypothetical protein [Nitrosomonas sp.]